MKDFIVDSKGRCFLCVTQTYSKNAAWSTSSSVKSIQFLSRYLKMDMGLVFLENGPAPPELLDKVKKSELKVELCEECAALNKTFSFLCRKLEKVEIEMKSCLNSLQSKLLSADKDFVTRSVIDRNEDGSGLLGKLKIANVLRREAVDKCSAKLKSAGPRIKLQKLSSAELIDERKKLKLTYFQTWNEPESSSLHSNLKHEVGNSDLELGMAASGERPDEDWNADYSDDLDNSDGLPPPTEFGNTSKLVLLTRGAFIKTDTGKHQCSLCRKEFAQRRYFLQHYKRYHLHLGYGCSSCGKKFNSLQILKRHEISVHMRVKYGCKKCDKTFSDPSSLRRHDKSAHLPDR